MNDVKQPQGIKELLELIEGVELLASTGVAIGADKKVSASDLTHVVGLLKKVDVVVAAVDNAKGVKGEVKDVDQAELLILGKRVFDMAKKLKAVYEANKGS